MALSTQMAVGSHLMRLPVLPIDRQRGPNRPHFSAQFCQWHSVSRQQAHRTKSSSPVSRRHSQLRLQHPVAALPPFRQTPFAQVLKLPFELVTSFLSRNAPTTAGSTQPDGRRLATKVVAVAASVLLLLSLSVTAASKQRERV